MKSLMFIAGAAIVAAALATGAPASAGPTVVPVPGDPNRMQTKVMLGDLDLDRMAGAEVAVQRIRRAVKAVCGGDDVSVYTLAQQSVVRPCSTVSMRDAVNRLNRPLVTYVAYGEKAPASFAAR